MTTATTPSWGDIADDLIKSTFAEKTKVLVAQIGGALGGSTQSASNISAIARQTYLLSHYLEAVENDSSPDTRLAYDLASLRNKIGAATDWSDKATAISEFMEKSPSLMQGYLGHDTKSAMLQLGEKFGHLFPEFLSKLSVTISVATTPLRVMGDYKEATALVQPLVDNHTLTKEAGGDYADVVTRVKLMQAAIMNLEPTTGYPLFKEWADKYHVPHDVQIKLDPTEVSKSLIEFAPEA
jgi:hypothetical protein